MKTAQLDMDRQAVQVFIGEDHPEELRAAYQRIAELESTLGECREYFDGRADADFDQDGLIPNAEMKLLCEIDEVLS